MKQRKPWIEGRVVFVLALLGMNTVYASQLLAMDSPFASGLPGPAFLPTVLCGFMYVMLMVRLVSIWRTPTVPETAQVPGGHSQAPTTTPASETSHPAYSSVQAGVSAPEPEPSGQGQGHVPVEGDVDTHFRIPAMSVLGPLLAIAAIVLFILVFTYAGYVPAAGLFCFLIAVYFNVERSGQWGRSVLLAAASAAAVTLIGWLFFVRLFDLYLPMWEL